MANENDIEIVIHGTDKSGQAFDSAEQRAEKSGSKLGGMFGKIGPMLAAGAVAAGAAAGMALIKGVQGAMERESVQAKLGAQLGGPPELQKELGGVAGKLYANAFGDSLTDAANSVRDVWQAGLVPEDESAAGIEKMTEKAMNLAKAFDLDVSRAAQVAGQSIKTGLAENGANAMDLLTRSLQKVPAAVRDDLLDALDEYGPFLKTVGITGEKAFGLLVKGAEKGMYGIDKTGDAIKEFTIRATDMSTASKVGFDALGMSQEQMAGKLLKGGKMGQEAFQQIITGLRNIKDPVKQSQAALALFGTPLEDLSVSEIPKFLDSLDLTKAGLGDVAGAADTMGQTLNDTAANKLESFKRKGLERLTDFGAGVIRMFEKIADNPKVQEFVATIQEHVLPALERMGKWIEEKIFPVISQLVDDYLSKGVEAFHELQGVIKENEKELKQLGEFFEMVADFIIDKVVPAVGPFLTSTLRTTIKMISGAVSTISLWVRAWNFLWSVVRRIGSWFAGPFANFFVSGYNRVRSATSAVVSWVRGRWDALIGFLRGIRGRVSGAFSGMFDGIKSALRSAINWVVEKWNNFRIPGIPTPFGTLGGIETPNLPYLAAGGIGSGASAVSRHEVMVLPRGTRVFPEGNTASMMGGSGGTLQLIVSVDPLLSGASRDLMAGVVKHLRFFVDHQGGGDVQRALGRKRGIR